MYALSQTFAGKPGEGWMDGMLLPIKSVRLRTVGTWGQIILYWDRESWCPTEV